MLTYLIMLDYSVLWPLPIYDKYEYVLIILCDVFVYECNKIVSPIKFIIYLDAKGNLKWSESEINVGLVNVNVDVRENLWSILTKIVELIVIIFRFF